METLLQDVRYAARRLLKSPGFTAVAVLTLALGIGANSAIFSVVNAVLLKPLPYPEPHELVGVFQLYEGRRAVMTPPNFSDVREQNSTLQEMSPYVASGLSLTGSGDPVRLEGAEVGTGFFDVLGVQPLLGRTFRADENEPGRTRVAVLDHSTWQQRFGSDPAIVGRTIQLNGNAHQVVGVMPEGFSFPADRAVWVPMEYDADFVDEDNRGAWYLRVIGRLKPGVSAEQAAAEVAGIGQQLEQAYPDTNTDVGMTVFSLHEHMVGNLRPAFLVLLGAVALVLLIACANVANLLLARATAREGEFAIRTALGAGRARLFRQLLTESLLLGLVGGALGLLLAVWGTSLLVSLRPEGIPRLDTVNVDATVVAFASGAALLTGVLFGLVPAMQLSSSGLASSIRSGGRGALSAKGSARLRSALVIGEMALAVMLLAGAGLLLQSFSRLSSVDPGFQPESALTFRLALPEAVYETDEERSAFFEQLTDRLKSLPGVGSAGAVMALPLTGFGFTFSFEVAGREPAPVAEEPSIQTRIVTPGYFQTMGIPVVRGRSFTAQDLKSSAQVVVISESAAREHFPGEDAIGKTITLGWGRGEGEPNVGGEVIGIVGDVRQSELAEDAGSALYAPHSQVGVGGMTVVMRTGVPPLSLAAAVRREVAELDPNLPIADLQPLEQIVAESVSQPRFYMLLLSIFAAVALALAAIGIFGVISYAVAQRTREIGIRLALGAEPRTILRLVVGGALALAGAGVVLGLLGAFAGTRLLSGLLYGIGATDPLTFVGVAVVLVGVAFVASYLPARAATRVDPNVALRYE